MRNLWFDFVYAFRTLRKSPGFTLVAVVSLALGIGANTAIFSLLDRLLLKSLPVEKPEELVMLDHTGPRRGSVYNEYAWSYLTYKDLRARNTVFSGLMAHFPSPLSIFSGGTTERVRGEIVSGNFFEVLGLGSAMGRLMTAADENTPGGHPVIVLSHGYWQRRFGGKSDILNKDIGVNGFPMTVIGVAQAGFVGLETGDHSDVFVPVMMKAQITPTWNGLDSRQVMWMHVFGRLKPGISRQQASAELNTLYKPILEVEMAAMRNVTEQFRKRFIAKKIELLDGHGGNPGPRKDLQAPLLVLMAMVGAVLLIACANVANLLMARSAARRKEIAVRLAMGAGRWRIVRQLMVESLMLGITGGLAGLLIAAWTIDLLAARFETQAEGAPPLASIDERVLLFTFALSVVTGVLFGLVPALQATRPDVAPDLKAGGVASGMTHARFRKALVVSQVAFSLLLLVAAGLFTRSLLELKNLNPGFRTESLMQFAIDAPLSGYKGERTIHYYSHVQQAIAALPGVTAVSMASEPMLDNSISRSSIGVPGYQGRDNSDDHNSMHNTVGTDFFRAIQMPLLGGREFVEADRLKMPKVAIVNEAFAKHYFKGEDPVGKRFCLGGEPGRPYDIEIVGMVGNGKHANLRQREEREFFFPHAQQENLNAMTFYVRTVQDPVQMANAIRRTVGQIDASIPVFGLRTVAAQVDRVILRERMVSSLAASFGVLATVLAAVGLYGVMAFLVARRTREIGIRMALGAVQGSVLRMVLREVGVIAAMGIGIGVPIALALGRYIESQLFGIKAWDVVVLAGAVVLLAAVSLLAGYFPARKAAQIDPMVALRYE